MRPGAMLDWQQNKVVCPQAVSIPLARLTGRLWVPQMCSMWANAKLSILLCGHGHFNHLEGAVQVQNAAALLLLGLLRWDADVVRMQG
jgi:hypothetical protein